MRVRTTLCATVAAAIGIADCAASAATLDGRYGSNDGVIRTAVITHDNIGVYKVLLSVKSGQCTGELEAYGEFKRGSLVAEPADQDDPCNVTISPRGAGITIREHKCLMWHGAGCDFNGQLQRR